MHTPSTADLDLGSQLGELRRNLEQVESVISVGIGALRHQNCERDLDVARVLQRDAADRLSFEMERVAAMLERVKRTSPGGHQTSCHQSN